MELNAGILKEIDDSRQEALDLLMELGKIPASSNHEEKRAEFCKTCIDAGVNAILGPGPHDLQGIEIYKGKPIFYSLGHFIFQTETVSMQPADAYQNKGMVHNTLVGKHMASCSKKRHKANY